MFRLLLLLSLLLPAVGFAQGKQPKPLTVQPLVDELAAKGELSKDQMKALKAAHRCLDADKNWDRGRENFMSPSGLYELTSSAVVCWQGAEKKARKLGAAMDPVTDWVAARALYLEAYRDYLWGIEAKMLNDRIFTCKRLTTAVATAAKMTESSAGLPDKFSDSGARAFAVGLSQQVDVLAAAVNNEHDAQKCK